ncbi:bifunctional hydroxymethylpyrimidine kinase/phosphomethylpyrimidine kinase [Salinicola rhizosphaerae]|uniref:hydroxymethylpyrimidine kinase n=1 Tax=Salinicola rhizosphaerae TaxID=1443141 RepID=A0ABQ3DW68_9GAMM|nr:hydroxymethylpyrimidine/phosphomethylpyrimidine kinase [Salinicola rhizosphaerae]GHB14060.1 hydroxymethylpyrimidine/phosphomethylpyrimidine kinase [Salinicola rhizosphaerae]
MIRYDDKPVVMILAGHDPSGGAGLVADAEAVRGCGGWPVTVPTAMTVQSTRDVIDVEACRGDFIRRAARALLDDFRVSAIKVGLIPDLEVLEAVIDVARMAPGVPLILDPVVASGAGTELSTPGLAETLRSRLLPLVDILTPNRRELALLAAAPEADEVTQVVEIMSLGCAAVLVTGTDPLEGEAAAGNVVHTLHTPELNRQWQWPRLPANYHGSGCTLASALASRLAAGEGLAAACAQAQRFTWDTLDNALALGQGQYLPDRAWRAPDFDATLE